MLLTAELMAAFARSELFAGCNPEHTVCRVRHFRKGSPVPGRLEGRPAIGVVVQGRVQVYSTCVDGTSVNISTLRPGESFGISNIFSGEEHATVLLCDRSTAVAYITRDRFMELLQADPAITIRYAVLCNRKLQYLTRKIEFLTMPTCRARLCGYLLKNRGEDDQVRLEGSKEQLASVLGVSRASLFRELRHLAEQGYISAQGKVIRIGDVPALELLVEQAAVR